MSTPRPSRRATFAWEDLTNALLWPMLLRAPAMALRPARMGMAALLVIVLALIASAPKAWLDGSDGPVGLIVARGGDAVHELRQGILAFEHLRVAGALRDVFVGLPIAVFRSYPWSTIAIILPLLLAWGVLGGSISRSAAVEFALNEREPWTRSLAFGLTKWHSWVFVKLGPVLVFGLGVGMLAVLGWLLGVKYVQVAPAVLYPIGLAGMIGCVVLLGAYLLSMPMLIPAVASEGTDAIDASQRCYAYALSRPLRLALYAMILLVCLVVVTLVLSAVMDAAVRACAWASTLLLDEATAEVLRQGAARRDLPAEAGGSLAGAARILGFWSAIPLVALAAYVVSYWFTAGSVLYLLVRQLCDGQDMGELWTPGHAPGVVTGDIPQGEDADYE